MGRIDPKAETTSIVSIGKDEMNLIDFPFARLGDKDKRKVIDFTWRDPEMPKVLRTWKASSDADAGMPTEYAERVYIALLAITHEQGFLEQTIYFSIHQALKIMRLGASQRDYQNVMRALAQLQGLTLKSEQSFWDNDIQERVSGEQFNLLDDLKYQYTKVKGKMVMSRVEVKWSDRLWKSFLDGYLKSLDLDFYYSLKRPLSRRMFRYLDKQTYRLLKNGWEYFEVGLYDIAATLGMNTASYRRPADIRSKLKPAIQELIDRGFLTKVAYPPKKETKGYYRIRLYMTQFTSEPMQLELEIPSKMPSETRRATQDEQLYEAYQTSEDLRQTWSQTLEYLKMQMEKSTFQGHFQGSKLLQIQDQRAVVAVQYKNSVAWLQNRLAENVLKALSRNFDTQQEVASITFVTIEEAKVTGSEIQSHEKQG